MFIHICTKKFVNQKITTQNKFGSVNFNVQSNSDQSEGRKFLKMEFEKKQKTIIQKKQTRTIPKNIIPIEEQNRPKLMRL